ncbi:MAG: serine/threonine protein kinase [Anaerolineales bacterium]|nr:serine/threonine protein kinase [Anaerolineales bacterium]
MAELIILNDRYQLEERLGSGGMAVVYNARDLTLERTVAIKILRKDYSGSLEFRARFHQEAKAAANLSHPNIVTVHDFGLYANQLFIVMEFVPGVDLKTLLKQRGRLGVTETIELMAQACSGIGYAHRAGLVHCDVKPQNMLVTPDKRLKVVDFGIARALTSISPDEQTEIVWGSPQYISPEQAAGGAPSPASDVYSLGVVLYEMLTGRLPFTGASSQELARLHRETLPPSPRKFNPAIPASLEQIVLKVLSKEPAARYRTADQLGRVLVNFSQQSIKGTSASKPSPPRQPAREKPYTPAPQPGPTPILPAAETQQATIIYTEPTPRRASEPVEFDWVTWILAMLALIVVGGLVPFWLWVYFALNPPL